MVGSELCRTVEPARDTNVDILAPAAFIDRLLY